MKTLVIHPVDPTTDFLKPVYGGLPSTTIVTGGVDKNTLYTLVKSHDQVMMMGHGSPAGLFAVSQFKDLSPYIVDWRLVGALQEKDNSVFIWCHADAFVERHGLKGFYTAMFISEVIEARLCRVLANQKEVDESNLSFAQTVGEVASMGPRLMHAAAMHKYGHLASYNRVAKYNHERLYVSGPIAG